MTRRREGWRLGGASHHRGCQVYRDPHPDRTLLNGPRRPSCHRRSQQIRHSEISRWRGATCCTGMSLPHISRQEQGKDVFRNWATRRITGSQKKKAEAQMIGGVRERRKWGPTQQLLREVLRQRRKQRLGRTTRAGKIRPGPGDVEVPGKRRLGAFCDPISRTYLMKASLFPLNGRETQLS